MGISGSEGYSNIVPVISVLIRSVENWQTTKKTFIELYAQVLETMVGSEA